MRNQKQGLRERRGHRVVGPLQTPQFERHFFGTSTALILTAVSIAVSIASAAMAYMQQQQAAQAAQRNQQAQADAQQRAIEQNAALASRAYMNESQQLQEKQRQADESAVTQEIGVSKQAAQARSTAITAAGEAGVSGLSVNSLLDDFTRQEVDYRTQSRTNLENTRYQTEKELEGAQMTAEGRTNSLKPFQQTPVQYPSLLGAALRVGGAAAGTIYANHYAGQPQKPPASWQQSPGGYGSRSETWGNYL